MSAIENVLSRLERVRRVGNGWMARCPAHTDNSPSLKLAVGEDGRVLLSCKVGCRTEDVLAELDLEWRDLFDSSGLPPRQVYVAKNHKRNSDDRPPLASRQDIEDALDSGDMQSTDEYLAALHDWGWGYTRTATSPAEYREWFNATFGPRL